VAGIGGLSLAVFLLVAKQMMRTPVFSQMTGKHTFIIFQRTISFAFIISIVGILAYVISSSNLIFQRTSGPSSPAVVVQ
jgi:hypothetical protein